LPSRRERRELKLATTRPGRGKRRPYGWYCSAQSAKSADGFSSWAFSRTPLRLLLASLRLDFIRVYLCSSVVSFGWRRPALRLGRSLALPKTPQARAHSAEPTPPKQQGCDGREQRRLRRPGTPIGRLFRPGGTIDNCLGFQPVVTSGKSPYELRRATDNVGRPNTGKGGWGRRYPGLKSWATIVGASGATAWRPW